MKCSTSSTDFLYAKKENNEIIIYEYIYIIKINKNYIKNKIQTKKTI